jgi:hypothetical protein
MGFIGSARYEATWTCDECQDTIIMTDSQETDDMLDRTILVPIPAPKGWAIMRWRKKALCQTCRDKVLDTEAHREFLN